MACLKLTYNENDTPLKVAYSKAFPDQKPVQSYLSTDPIGFIFPWQSPYAYAMQSPITFVDHEGNGPKKSNGGPSSETPALSNSRSSSKSFAHPLVAVAKTQSADGDVTKDDRSPNYRHGAGNFDEIFTILPGQTSFWYGDAGVYDRIQLVIDNPPPPVVLWDSDDNRTKRGNIFKSTNEVFKDERHPLGLDQSSGMKHGYGWGHYDIPALFNGHSVNQIHVVVTAWQNKTNPIHDFPVHSYPVINPASVSKQKNSTWGVDLLPKQESKPTKDETEPTESHRNVRTL